MSLTQALSTSLTGLNAAQTALSVVAGNIANAQTPGYVKKTAVQVETAYGTTGSGVEITSINRVLDAYIQAQTRTEQSGASYADLSANFYQQIQSIYGDPGSTASLEGAYNNFTGSLQALTTSPDDPSTQQAVIGAAQVLTQQLNTMTNGIQSLRSQAEVGLSTDVTKANAALQQIALLNQQLNASGTSDATTAALEDQRDNYIDQLSQLMDIKTVQSGNDQVSVFTTSGVQLAGITAAQLSFNAQGAVSAQSQWSADPSKSTLGTITLTAPNGTTTDLIATGAIHSGEIAAYLQMRDKTLVQAQNQIDQLAAGMSSALSDQQTAGSTVTGPPAGFDVDVGSLLNGNSVNITYTDSSSTQHTITLIRADDPAALPLSNNATPDPNDTVVGINFSGGMSSVISQINAAIGADHLVASNPSGSALRIVDDGTSAATVNALSTTTTATTLAGGSPQLPFFLDNGQPYSGAITGGGSQSVGLAGRITVNSALVADPGALVAFQAGTAAADDTRPNFIYNQMVNAPQQISPTSGIGSASSPYSGPLGNYLQEIISQQAQAATDATNLKQGQDVVLSSLQQRFNANSGVNIDEEMSNLLNLQNSYAANARVMSTIKDMLTSLLQM